MLKLRESSFALAALLLLAPSAWCGTELTAAQRKSALLISAAEDGDLNVITALLKEGVDIESKNDKGRTALIAAAVAGRSDSIALLLSKKAAIEAKDSRGDTALHEAAEYARLDSVELLLAHGADIETINENGDSPLTSAGFQDRIEVVQRLLDHGAKIDVRNKKGDTVYDYAKRWGHGKIVKALEEAESERGVTPPWASTTTVTSQPKP